MSKPKLTVYELAKTDDHVSFLVRLEKALKVETSLITESNIDEVKRRYTIEALRQLKETIDQMIKQIQEGLNWK